MACLSEDLCCPVCQDVFVDPVLLSCSHSFCKLCLHSWWNQKHSPECPVCRKTSQFEPACNLALKNLCEAFLQEREDEPALCPLHSDKLQLFCLDHQELSCLVCRDSKRHSKHTFRPVDEAAQSVKEQLLKALKPVQEKVQRLRETQGKWQQMAQHIKDQAQSTENKITETFKKLHQFLAKEEEARISALREEEEQKSLMMKKQIEVLSREIAALTHTVRTTEEELQAKVTTFLLHHKATVQRVKRCSLLEDPTLPPGALINVAKHLGNLNFHIWRKMKDLVSFCPVVLDPNTAAADLLLSEDLMSVVCGDTQLLPVNPERLKSSSVLAAMAFSSGTHSWDVVVGHNTLWELGVVEESAYCRRDIYSGLWRVGFYEDEYRTYCPSEQFLELSLRGRPQKIRLHLDWDKGTLSFFDPDTDTHIHTFTHIFTDRLLPYLCTVDAASLRISAVDVSVVVDQQQEPQT